MNGFNNIYKNKTVLVTGHTGFKGSWLSVWLHELGANVVGYALDPYTERDNYVVSGLGEKIIDIRGDIRDRESLHQVFAKYNPEIVFHLAAQSLVGLSYKDPINTYETNVIGTANVLEAIRNCNPTKTGIMVTTDKCYENVEQIWGYKESDPLGGYDPYSSSKGATEIAIKSWRLSFMNPHKYDEHGKAIASVRAGNIIGGGDWAKDRIVPDCIRALEENRSIGIRSPKAIRPWQYVLEPLSGYLLLGEKMALDPVRYSEPWNFGPDLDSIVTVWDIATRIVENYGWGQIEDLSSIDSYHEAQLLSLDISKAKLKLGWKPTFNLDDAVRFTVAWYKNYKEQDIYSVCKDQIEEFSSRGGYS